MSKRMFFPCAATVLATLCMTLAASRADDRDEGRGADPAVVAARQKISIYYHFKLRGQNRFTFAWHNTSGALKEGCASPNNDSAGNPTQPGQDAQGCFGLAVGQRVAQIMESLRPTDVEIGSVVSLGSGINGERDIVTYNRHIAPKVFIPNHVTVLAVESSSLEWKVGYLKQQTAMGIPDSERPELMWLVDPNDYLRPLVFDPKDDRWRKPGDGDRDD